MLCTFKIFTKHSATNIAVLCTFKIYSKSSTTNIPCSAPLNSKQTFCYKYSVLCTFKIYSKSSTTNIPVLYTFKLYSKHSATNITVLRTFLFRYSVNHPYPNFPVQIYYCYDKKQQSCEIFVETEPSSIIQGAEHRNIIHI